MNASEHRGLWESADGGRPSGRQKTVLFCPDCGHESLVDGDWVATDDYVARTRYVRCPECSATVTDRPLPADSAVGSDAPTADAVVAGPVGRTVETAARLWTHSMRHWLQWSRRADV